MLFDRHPEYRSKYGDRHFWARGYYASTVENVNKETVLIMNYSMEGLSREEGRAYISGKLCGGRMMPANSV